MKLLSFLHVRSAYPPCDWAPFDAHEMKRYFQVPQVPLMFNNKCVKISSEDYGSMVEFDVSRIHSGETLGYPRAWATICVQQYMVADLRNVVDKIVDGAPPSGNVNWTNLVTGGLRNQADSPRWGVYDNQGFAPPSRFDPEALLDMANDQLNRVVDEVELLQSDPDYLRDYALTMKANISWDTDVQPWLKWSYVSGILVASWAHRLSRWQTIVAKSQELASLCRNNRSAIYTQGNLPSDIETAITSYGLLLRETLEIELTGELECLQQDVLERRDNFDPLDPARSGAYRCWYDRHSSARIWGQVCERPGKYCLSQTTPRARCRWSDATLPDR